MTGAEGPMGVHDEVEILLRKPSKKKALLLPRGHLKSTLVTVGYSIQRILQNPNVRILIANQVWDMSRRFLSEIKGQLEGSQLKYIFGEFQSARWNSDDIIVRQRNRPIKEPTILTTGVEAETTGGHFDVIFLDDLTGVQNSQTPEQREKTKRFRRSMVNLLDPGGTLVEIGTRWHLDDTFADILEKEHKYYDVLVKKVIDDQGKIIFPQKFSKRFNPKTRSWSADYDIIDKDGMFAGQVSAADAGEALMLAEKRFPDKGYSVKWNSDPNCMDYIDYLKASMPIDEFMSQYMNDPISSENQVFKQDMFQYWTKRPEGLYVGMGVDLAISQRTEADYTALMVLGMDKDWNLYVLDFLRGHWTPTEIVNNIFDMQSRWKPHALGMETNGFQRTLKMAVEEEMRRRKQYFGIDEIRNGPEKSKESRIKSLEPFYRRKGVFHAAWMKGKDFETELLTFPKGRHDDIIDAMAMTLPMLSPGIGVSKEEIPQGSFAWIQREAIRWNGRYSNYLNF